MGFSFAETMSGTVEWDRDPGKQHPFSFEISVHAGSTRDHLKTGIAEIRGIVHAPPVAATARAEGTITIRPVGERIIRYELTFTGDDGRRYEVVGQKDLQYRRLLATWTTLPLEILDDEHRRVATCLTRFDLRRQSLRFLKSFRPA